jgi:DNA-binding MarR family transcriptional regulator
MPGPSVDVSTLVLRLARELRSSLDGAFGAVGLTSQQAGLLIHIFGGESSPKELSALLGTDTAGMTRMLDRLERKGLVTREHDPRDRRAVTVTLTSAGRAAVPSLPAVFERVAARLVGDRDPIEVATVLRALLANLDGEASSDATARQR